MLRWEKCKATGRALRFGGSAVYIGLMLPKGLEFDIALTGSKFVIVEAVKLWRDIGGASVED